MAKVRTFQEQRLKMRRSILVDSTNNAQPLPEIDETNTTLLKRREEELGDSPGFYKYIGKIAVVDNTSGLAKDLGIKGAKEAHNPAVVLREEAALRTRRIYWH